MNFEKLFEVCEITPVERRELLKALIEHVLYMNEQPMYNIDIYLRDRTIRTIKSILSVKRPIKWPEIKEILEDE